MERTRESDKRKKKEREGVCVREKDKSLVQNSLCVSQLFAGCVCVLLGPVITTHSHPARPRTVHLQHTAVAQETH